MSVISQRVGQERSLAIELAKKVSEYYQDPAHRREFERWYKETYGKSYVWEDRRERAS